MLKGRLDRVSGVLFIAIALISSTAPFSETDAQSLMDGAKSLFKKTLENNTGDVTGNSSPLPGAASLTGLSTEEIIAGLKEALVVGTRLVTDGLGADGGFLNDSAVRIPLPPTAQKIHDVLKPLGFGSLGDTVQTRMNQGAEQAMDDAGDILIRAVQAMTLEDAKQLLEGPDDAATTYLRRVSGSDIESRLRPIIDQSLKDVGALQALDQMIGQYGDIPFTPDVTVSLTDHATELAMSGLFTYLAQEEKSIRENPAARTTDILKRVFSGG